MNNRPPDEENPFASPQSAGDADSSEIKRNLDDPLFAERMVAWIIDSCIGLVIVAFVSFGMVAMIALMDRSPPQIDMVWYSCVFVSVWMYHAVSESSSARATLGKRLLGLQVVDLSRRRLSFLHATGRYFSKFFSAIPLFAGYLIQPFTPGHQAFHDILMGTLVIKKK